MTKEVFWRLFKKALSSSFLALVVVFNALSLYSVRFAKWLFALVKQKYVSAREQRRLVLETSKVKPIHERKISKEDSAPSLVQLKLIHAELHSDEKSL